MTADQGHFLALSGGVGGAKLALGLSQVLPPESLSVLVNTGDDFTHLGLRICPDLDSLMYALSFRANQALGWGQEGETWQFLEALGQLGGETWFRLGDRDLATHIQRTQWLASGLTLTEVTQNLCRNLGIKITVLPMTDDVVATEIICQSGDVLAFQHYFVREQCQPPVLNVQFKGIETATLNPAVGALLDGRSDLTAVIICPSNPFVSVKPILDLDQTAERLIKSAAPVIAVSPIVSGLAIKGPAAKMMGEMSLPTSALGVAEYYVSNYPGVLDAFVIDQADESYREAIEALGLKVFITDTIMQSLEDRKRLADDLMGFCESMRA
jgi:LPPG:FO 2-phospho-L-lactate transferase